VEIFRNSSTLSPIWFSRTTRRAAIPIKNPRSTLNSTSIKLNLAANSDPCSVEAASAGGSETPHWKRGETKFVSRRQLKHPPKAHKCVTRMGPRSRTSFPPKKPKLSSRHQKSKKPSKRPKDQKTQRPQRPRELQGLKGGKPYGPWDPRIASNSQIRKRTELADFQISVD
jgi:hypothetical protein